MYHIDAPEEQVKTLNGEALDRFRALFTPSGSRGREPQELVLLRILDLAVAVTALVFFAPLMVLVALVVWLQDGGPVFFAQRRVGFQGRTFRCYKFRTMVVDADRRLEDLLRSSPEARREWEADHKLRKDPRITRLGEFLRKSSLDELPQLFNVLRGEMSAVGPRPITDAEICRYGRWFRHYRSVRPGMTGLWQVSGRNHVDYRRRVALDVLYVQRRSVGCNLAILLRTIPAVLLRSGSY